MLVCISGKSGSGKDTIIDLMTSMSSFRKYPTMKFYTSNQNKIKEAQKILGTFVGGRDLDLPEIQDTDTEATTRCKILEAKKRVDGEFIVEDSGLELGKDKEIGALIKWLSNYRVQKAYLGEEATAVCVIGHSSGKIFKGEVKGTIVQARGYNGFGFDEIFEVNGTIFAEMTPEEKNAISPRRIALEKLKEYLEDEEELCTDVI